MYKLLFNCCTAARSTQGEVPKTTKNFQKPLTTVVFATEAGCKRGKTRRVVSVIYSDYLKISNVLTTLN